jgi:hypothetical protein
VKPSLLVAGKPAHEMKTGKPLAAGKELGKALQRL